MVASSIVIYLRSSGDERCMIRQHIRQLVIRQSHRLAPLTPLEIAYSPTVRTTHSNVETTSIKHMVDHFFPRSIITTSAMCNAAHGLISVRQSLQLLASKFEIQISTNKIVHWVEFLRESLGALPQLQPQLSKSITPEARASSTHLVHLPPISPCSCGTSHVRSHYQRLC